MANSVKYPRSEVLARAKSAEQSDYIFLDFKNKQATENTLSQLGKTVASYQAVATHLGRTRNFEGLAPHVDGKPGLLWSDYDHFRSGEAVPHKFNDILTACNTAYREVGLIRSVIDLMSDFACQGIRVVHRNKRIEKFYETWWKQVQGKNTSERFLNYLLRLGNNVIRMQTAKIRTNKRERMMRAMAADVEVINRVRFEKAEIPWQYNFLDPRNIEVVGGSLANFLGEKEYKLQLPDKLRQAIRNNLNSPNTQIFLSKLPSEIRSALSGSNFNAVSLPSDRTFVFHYRKDDWDTWALPLIFACLDDIITLRKLKLADRAALDGATSKVRFWKLGSLEHGLAPSPAASAALADILGSSVGGGTIDAIWGPDIELLESNTDVHNFLGEEKYKPTLVSIYQCLGIPPSLTGTFGQVGTTNNLISLKTLTERLKYIRGILVEFWDFQIRLVQEGMGFRFPADIEFDFLNLDDPATINQLFVNLADRSIISDEFIHRHIGANTDMEVVRLKRESMDREKGRLPMKASPYHEPEQEFGLKKIFAQTGAVTPSEVSLELAEKKEGQRPALMMKQVTQNSSKKAGTPGRPKGTPDTKPRKERRFTPVNKAKMELWAKATLDRIGELIRPGILSTFAKKNIRSLTKEEFDATEKIKFELLCNLEPFQNIDLSVINNMMADLGKTELHQEFQTWLNDLSGDEVIEDIREIRASFYVYLQEQNDGESNG